MHKCKHCKQPVKEAPIYGSDAKQLIHVQNGSVYCRTTVAEIED